MALYSISWVVYGIFITDFYLVFPNSVSIILSLVQIFIYLNFKKKYPSIEEKEFISTIGIETNASEEKKEEETIKMDEADIKGKEQPVKIVSKI